MMNFLILLPAIAVFLISLGATEISLAAESIQASQVNPGTTNQCARLTLRPRDQINPSAAINACESAVKSAPTAQNFFQYGRALHAAKRYEEAMRWFERAATQEHAEGLRALGESYYFGEGVKKDVHQGGRLIRQSAEAGSPRGQNLLATIQFKGAAGASGGRRAAVSWWKKAAEQGYATAQHNLGMTYETGKGQWYQKADLGLAAYWYREAALQGHPAARKNLIALYADHPRVEQSMRQRFGNEALPPTRLFYDNWPYGGEQNVAEMSDSQAIKTCKGAGQILLDQLDAKTAIIACKRAIRLSPTQEVHYGFGRSLLKTGDYAGANKQFKAAAGRGNLDALAQIGLLHESGRVGQVDKRKAVSYYMDAARNGSRVGQYYLGSAYFNGLPNLPQDYKQSFYWFQLSAKQGIGHAQNMLGYQYFHGLGVQPDLKKANYWFVEAVDNGSTAAIKNLSDLDRKMTQLRNERIAREAEARSRAANEAFNDLATGMLPD
jgi:TPR repeat protein